MDEEPLLRIVRGEPADDELAALVTVLTARSPDVAAPPPTRAWIRSGRPVPGLTSWRDSGLPL